jgi:hypothetical protein
MADRTTLVVGDARALAAPGTRRGFLKLMGVGGTALLLPSLFAACDDDGPTLPGSDGSAVTLDLSTDVGILNYAYALEQLEAAFYTQVVAGFSANGISVAAERSALTEIRNHEVIHREALAAALGSARLGNLSVDFGSAINSRDTILAAAQTFEDLGVSAYNGAGKYLGSAQNLLVAGKIVSVEARHAAAIRDIRNPNDGRAFAGDDVVDENGLDVVAEPVTVLTAADPFVENQISIGRGPTA